MKRTVLIVICIVLFTLSVNLGAVGIPILTVWKIVINKLASQEIFDPSWSKPLEMIIWKIRVPRSILAFITGASLSIVGIFMQVVTRNSLADPYILGLSSGASTGAILCMLLGLNIGLGAFVGAFISIILVLLIVRGDYSSGKLILTGVAISSIFSSLTNVMIYFTKGEAKVKSILFWMTGSLGGVKWEKLGTLTLALIVMVILGLVVARELDIMLLGEADALSLGVEVRKLKFILIICSSVLTGLVVSLTGTIGFVGLIIPHISRTIVGNKHKELIPTSIILGGSLMIGADILSRTAFRPEELPIGIFTSLIGGPFFLWLIFSKNKLGKN